MKKKSKSIAFSISVFFVALNFLCFAIVVYLVQTQYNKMAERMIEEKSKTAMESMAGEFKDLRSQINDLTLKIYSDKALNSVCSQLFREEYKDEAEMERLVLQAERLCYDYLYYYSYNQSLGIFIENQDQTNIQLRKTYNAMLIDIQKSYREEIQDKVLANKGIIKCFDVGTEHQIVYARTLKDFANVLKDDRIIGTVMISISDQYMEKLLKKAKITPNSYVFLENKDGVISCCNIEDQRGEYMVPLQERLQKERYKISSQFIDALDMRLIIAVSPEDISLSTRELLSALTRYIWVILGLNLILVWMISMNLTKPMDRLVSQIKKIGVGGLKGQKIQAQGYSEIENIAENFNQMLERIEHLMEENYLIGISEKNARIEALQSQINPHFIFNTLDTLNWKVMFLDVPEVSNMITCLGNMLRYNTYQYGKCVTVEQEVTQIQNYLYIQEIRYDHSFQTHIKIQKEVKDRKIPCLIIQPLVENAVVHGLHGKKNGVLVVRCREKENGILEIMVFDNGQGMDEETRENILKKKDDRESIGLANVEQRLRLTYSLENGLKISSKVNYYTKIEMEIPYTKGEV